ncbi:hypothetical protein TGP89_321600 [Toxoplasma gondii p89]|uniref:Uncharacterized protein n=1 Tax=Toxoplasma gondii p89 TaxID=943119 RepID=A0A086J7F1_TOXGO|nr:hypothetical protein TGP89_321600 [Toxoplasma gondii p89]
MAADAVDTSQSAAALPVGEPGSLVAFSKNGFSERQSSLTTDGSGAEKASQSDFLPSEESTVDLLGCSRCASLTSENDSFLCKNEETCAYQSREDASQRGETPKRSFRPLSTNEEGEISPSSPAAETEPSTSAPQCPDASVPHLPSEASSTSLNTLETHSMTADKCTTVKGAQATENIELFSERGGRLSSARRSSSQRPRANWLTETLKIQDGTGSSFRAANLDGKSAPRNTEAESDRPRGRWIGDLPESVTPTNFQGSDLTNAPREVPRKHTFARSAPVKDFQKQLVDGKQQLVKAELEVATVEDSAQKGEAETNNSAFSQKKCEASSKEKDANCMREEIHRLKNELRIANSTADFLQKALRDRSTREIEMKNHIVALTAVNKDLQKQAKALTRMLSRVKGRTSRAQSGGIATESESEEKGSSGERNPPRELPPTSSTDPSEAESVRESQRPGYSLLSLTESEGDSQAAPAQTLRITSAESAAFSFRGASDRSKKVQFDVCPVFGDPHYSPIRTCPVDTALAQFVNQRTNKIIFTRVRPGLYIYGRMPVRVQLGTDPETQTRRLEVVARGRRYTIANFINMFEDSEFAVIDLAHKKTGGSLPLELSSLPGSQPLAYASTGPGAETRHTSPGSELSGGCTPEKPGFPERAGFSESHSLYAFRGFDEEFYRRSPSLSTASSLLALRSEAEARQFSRLDGCGRGHSHLHQRCRHPLSPGSEKDAAANGVCSKEGVDSREALTEWQAPRSVSSRKSRATQGNRVGLGTSSFEPESGACASLDTSASRLGGESESGGFARCPQTLGGSPRPRRVAVSATTVNETSREGGRVRRGKRQAAEGSKTSFTSEGRLHGRPARPGNARAKKGPASQSVGRKAPRASAGVRTVKPRSLASGGRQSAPNKSSDADRMSPASVLPGSGTLGSDCGGNVAKNAQSVCRASVLKKKGARNVPQVLEVHWGTLGLSPAIGKAEERSATGGVKHLRILSPETSPVALHKSNSRQKSLLSHAVTEEPYSEVTALPSPHASEPTPAGARGSAQVKGTKHLQTSPLSCEPADQRSFTLNDTDSASHSDLVRLRSAAFPVVQPPAESTSEPSNKFPFSSPVRDTAKRRTLSQERPPFFSTSSSSPDPPLDAFPHTESVPNAPRNADAVQLSRRRMQSTLWPVPSSAARISSTTFLDFRDSGKM